jgi:hypothetical protein
MQRAGTGIHPDGVFSATVRCKVLFELLHGEPKGELSGFHHRRDRLEHFVSDGLEFGRKVRETDHRVLISLMAARVACPVLGAVHRLSAP